MRLAVVGGKLQGIEACYLARKAGYEVLLVDRRASTPAAGLAHGTHQLDITVEGDRAVALLSTCDAVLPACEDDGALAWLDEHRRDYGVPLLFDIAAYRVSSSKLASNKLFEELDVPRPRPWPDCGFPVVVKPSVASGSEAVAVVRGEDELAPAVHALWQAGHEPVVEEFVGGPSLSLEVLGTGDAAVPLFVTGLEFDAGFDCRRVTAPVETSPVLLAAFEDASVRLALGLGLVGIMDVEVMVDGVVPKVIEIDARLPSQTPAAVFHAYDVNLVELLVRTGLEGRVPDVARAAQRAAVFEHVRVAGGRIEVVGEHVMGGAGPLAPIFGFYGAFEALTDYAPGKESWVATLITRGDTLAEARAVADGAVRAIAGEHGLTVAPEAGPSVLGDSGIAPPPADAPERRPPSPSVGPA